LQSRAACQVAKGHIDLGVDRRDHAVRVFVTPDVIEKRVLFPSLKKILQQAGNTRGPAGAQGLARVAQRGQIDVAYQVRRFGFGLSGLETSRPQRDAAACMLGATRLIAHAEDGDILRRIGNGGDQKSFQGIAHAAEPAFDGEGGVGHAAADVLFFGVTIAPAVERQGQQGAPRR
jgi:hypothetical protein